jgi:hypothetical protein
MANLIERHVAPRLNWRPKRGGGAADSIIAAKEKRQIAHVAGGQLQRLTFRDGLLSERLGIGTSILLHHTKRAFRNHFRQQRHVRKEGMSCVAAARTQARR